MLGDRFYQQRGRSKRGPAGSSKGFSLTGFDALQKTLEELPVEIAGPIVRTSFRKGATVVRDGASRRAPRSRSAVNTGFNRAAAKGEQPAAERKTLAESVKVVQAGRTVRSRSELVFIVRCKHALAHIFEYGTQQRYHKSTSPPRYTGRISAHPFMRPALDVEGPKAIDVIKEVLTKLLERAAKRIAKKNGSVK